jgi:hypothetical protein
MRSGSVLFPFEDAALLLDLGGVVRLGELVEHEESRDGEAETWS